MGKLVEWFTKVRRAGVPLVGITTPDPVATISAIKEKVFGEKNESPILSWDLIRGMLGVNDLGVQAAMEAISGGEEPAPTNAPTDALQIADKLPERSVLFFHNAQNYLDKTKEGAIAVSQAICNLRENFKGNHRTLVLLGPMIELPPELSEDIMIFDEPYPTDEQLGTIITDLMNGARDKAPEIKPLSKADLSKAVNAVSGVAAFPTEQSTAMSLSKNGLDITGLWEFKRQIIEQQKGLSVWRGGERFKDIEGVANVKNFMSMLLHGRRKIKGVVFIDEIEKSIAGAAGDLSGTSQGMLGKLLSYTQDNNVMGVVFTGVAGTAKSMIAKATGNEAGIPTIYFDLKAMEGSLVGDSIMSLGKALKVVSAVTGGDALFIATCNKMSILPPELKSRFRHGTFFFDTPTPEEQAAIWTLYLKKYGLKDKTLPKHEGWTGREIWSCCELAWTLNKPLEEAAKYIVPVAVSGAEEIERMRVAANGRFVSASFPGPYRYIKSAASSAQRRVAI